MNDIYREVEFDKYCKTCKYEEQNEKLDPCCECLDYGYNIETRKPVNWKEKNDI